MVRPDAQVTTVAQGVHAYVQGDGSWGWANAGLITSDDQALLVDTLFDLRLTESMLEAFRKCAPGAFHIDTVVNTHANGDHCYGNIALPNARIIASEAAAAEMRLLPPGKMAVLLRAARLLTKAGASRRYLSALFRALNLHLAANLTDAADYVVEAFSPFHFDGIAARLPTDTFQGTLPLTIGNRSLEVIEVGPAHTRGDVIVHVPDARTVFTGDLLFVDHHPLIWAGPLANWIAACERIEALAPEVIVPGHGPVVGLDAVRTQRQYVVDLLAECRNLRDAGLEPDQAAATLARQGFGSHPMPERLLPNVRAAYRELDGQSGEDDAVEVFGAMARLAQELSDAAQGRGR